VKQLRLITVTENEPLPQGLSVVKVVSQEFVATGTGTNFKRVYTLIVEEDA
jgi:hypothetical protein